MRKVLVDRELLERCVDRWACCAIVETPGAEQAWLELRAVVKAAQPAEVEGMDLQRLSAEFEAWWDRQPHREQFEDVKDQMRNVWLASRRELAIELPDPNKARDIAYYKADIEDAIEAAGVTVRG
ncbi:hypothetical protein K9B43_15690 [Pseudomonas sp. S5(2021)]|nr:hypothetical protein [Pseudomonas sp. S5(2021)]